MNATAKAAVGHDEVGGLYEFDRERVPDSRLLGPGYFAGAFAGEHVAATEFVIGVTFVNWGAAVQDIFLVQARCCPGKCRCGLLVDLTEPGFG